MWQWDAVRRVSQPVPEQENDMAKKSAAEKAAEEAAAVALAVEAARHETEKKRMMWAGLFLAAVAVFAGGYAIGHSDDDTLVAADSVPAIVPVGPGIIQGGVVPGPGVMRGPGGVPGPTRGMGGPGLGPDGQSFPGDCPFGIFQPEDGNTTPAVTAPGFLGVGVSQAPQGVLVVELAAGSPAVAAGIEVDDVIVGFNGTVVTTVGQFSRLVRFVGDGATVEMTVLRSGNEVTLEALLGTIPG
jgi:membrane-associated protease RseP (regulator of RpoE activity)